MTKNMVENLNKWSHNEIKEAVSSVTCSEGTAVEELDKWKGVLFAEDIEIQQRFEPWSSEFLSIALTNRTTEALVLKQKIDDIYLLTWFNSLAASLIDLVINSAG